MITSKVKKVSLDHFKTLPFLMNNFSPNFKFDYNFQYRYRAHSIYFIFLKEFCCALFILCIFQYISYQYLDLFNIEDWKDLTEAEKEAKLEDNLDTYKSYNILAFMFSFSLIAS